ncbi:hypothetical protein [Amycolatopsis alba]|uniref:Uncharacterized protein n=1 Tax=Amycolatopsis alba DSM 44262 TaxID=1125972 RepID=A0A229RAE5_AMYAL|nr:hypothetical protein [Amycolatopsis alba]OXM43421.1 hypothetical protein CFP75_38245 [Amycolatopsis alba DSM 44262]
MRSFHDILSEIDQQLTDADHIPTNAPASVAAYLRELITRHTQWATTQGTVSEVVTADTIRHEIAHLTQH